MRGKLLTRKNFFQLLLLDVMVEKKHLLVVLQASDHRPKIDNFQLLRFS
jgi:hypothetical protein